MTTNADKSALFSLAWRAFAPEGAPQPVGEYRFHPTRKWRFDWFFPGAGVGRQGVACEIDGGQFAYRGGRHATDADRTKLNHAAAMGITVFRFSVQQMTDDPAACVALVVQGLGLKAADDV